MPTAYSINDANIVQEVMDGEAMMINLVTGHYYTLNETGSIIWQFFQHQQSYDHALSFMQQACHLPRAQIDSFVTQLEQEHLILSHDLLGKSDFSPVIVSKSVYDAPELKVYTDMQDLLLCDPVHDVKEMGWPHVNPAEKPALKLVK